MNGVFRQLGKFATVGIAATGLHLLAAITLHYIFHMGALGANFLAFLVASGFSYFGNWSWTFNRSGRLVATLPRFLVVNVFCFAINQGIVFILVEQFDLPLFMALLPVVAVVPVMGFWLNKTHVFVSDIQRNKKGPALLRGR